VSITGEKRGKRKVRLVLYNCVPTKHHIQCHHSFSVTFDFFMIINVTTVTRLTNVLRKMTYSLYNHVLV